MARMKRATFRDAQTLARARAARRREQQQAEAGATAKIEGPTRTAAEAYREVATETETLMETLFEALQRHHDALQLNPGWAGVGDIRVVRDRLREALAAARGEYREA